MAHDAGAQSQSDSGALGPSLVLAALAAVAVVYGFSASAPTFEAIDASSFELKSPTIDEERLKRERARYAEVDHELPALKAFEKTLRAGNLLQFEAPDRKAVQDAEIAIEYAANEAASAAGGYKAFVTFAEPMYHACQNELSRAIKAIAAGDVSVEAMSTQPPPGWEVYRETCGNVIPMLIEVGLMTPKAAWVDPGTGPAIFDILLRFRIAHIIQLRVRPLDQLTPYERELLWRWRIEAPNAYDSKTRIAYLERALRLTDERTYPTAFDAARVYYREGQKERAWQAIEAICSAGKASPAERGYCDFLRPRGPSPDA